MVAVTKGELPLQSGQWSKFDRTFWKVDTDSECVLVIKDSNDVLIVLDYSEINYQLVCNKRFYVNPHIGYAVGRMSLGSSGMKYLHEILMRDVPKPSPSHKYVDHINRIKTDNRMCNLRWVTQAENNQNTGKRARKTDAKNIPQDSGLSHKDLPKYVVYYQENIVSKVSGKVTTREFFRIEKHPAGEDKWATSKSSKFTLKDKLQEAKCKLAELEETIATSNANIKRLENVYKTIINHVQPGTYDICEEDEHSEGVHMIDPKTMETIGIFFSIENAAKFMKESVGNTDNHQKSTSIEISNALSNSTKKAYGYLFKTGPVGIQERIPTIQKEPQTSLQKLMKNPPKGIQYFKETDKRGSKWVISRHITKTTDISSTGKKGVSDEEKFKEILQKYSEITTQTFDV